MLHTVVNTTPSIAAMKGTEIRRSTIVASNKDWRMSVIDKYVGVRCGFLFTKLLKKCLLVLFLIINTVLILEHERFREGSPQQMMVEN
jgi:hypothetical protein